MQVCITNGTKRGSAFQLHPLAHEIKFGGYRIPWRSAVRILLHNFVMSNPTERFTRRVEILQGHNSY
jgi:hypothetical protein